MSRLCPDYVQIMSRICPESVQNLSRICPENDRKMAVKWPGTLKPTSENLERILTELERPAEASKIIIIIIIIITIIIIKSKEEDSVQNRNGEKREPVFCKK